jgi:hypothetical protein
MLGLGVRRLTDVNTQERPVPAKGPGAVRDAGRYRPC